MKNTITIKIDENITCECLDSIYNGENSLYLQVVSDKTWGLLLKETNTEVVPDDNMFLVPANWYQNSDLHFWITCENVASKEITIKAPATTEGNMRVQMIDTDTYQVNYYKSDKNDTPQMPYTLPPATTEKLGGVIVGEGLKVAENGLLSVDPDGALSETSENSVKNKVIAAKLNEVFQSVSDGKKQIASAITDKGVDTQSDATFSQMAENILNIPTGGDGQNSNFGIRKTADTSLFIKEFVITQDTTFAEIAEVLGMNYDADTNVMYMGSNKTTGFQWEIVAIGDAGTSYGMCLFQYANGARVKTRTYELGNVEMPAYNCEFYTDENGNYSITLCYVKTSRITAFKIRGNVYAERESMGIVIAKATDISDNSQIWSYIHGQEGYYDISDVYFSPAVRISFEDGTFNSIGMPEQFDDYDVQFQNITTLACRAQVSQKWVSNKWVKTYKHYYWEDVGIEIRNSGLDSVYYLNDHLYVVLWITGDGMNCVVKIK